MNEICQARGGRKLSFGVEGVAPIPAAPATTEEPVAGGSTRLAVVTSSSLPSQRLVDVHRLRALVILQIVFLHVAGSGLGTFEDHGTLATGSAEDASRLRLLFWGLQLAFHDSTIYFVAISGLLYSRVFAARSTLQFYRARARNVLVPFVLFSTLLSTVAWAPGHPVRWATWPLSGFAVVGVNNLLYGTAQFHLWFIPVALVLFALSPLLYRLVTNRRLFAAAVFVAMAPLIVSRTQLDVGVEQIVYFAGPYLIGMVIGRDVVAARALVGNRLGPLGLIAAGATAALPVAKITGFEFIGRTSLLESLFYVQKLAMLALLLHLSGGLLAKAHPAMLKILDWIAERAFPLYLLHILALDLLLEVAMRLLGPGRSLAACVLVLLVLYFAALALCALLIGAVRKVAGARSRLLIGA